MPMIYCFDIDGTICETSEYSQYHTAKPYKHVVDEINRLYDQGNIIKVMTARGCVSGLDHTYLTKTQLDSWGLKYHELIMNKKPHAHLFVDDRAIHIDDWIKTIPVTRGLVAGAFDIIHPGYIMMFQEAKMQCSHLTVALHKDPSMDRANKDRPVFSVKERERVLRSIKYVDDVVVYQTEQDLYEILQNGIFDIRFLGDDYFGKNYTGKDLDIKISWIDRSHGYSSSIAKRLISESISTGAS